MIPDRHSTGKPCLKLGPAVFPLMRLHLSIQSVEKRLPGATKAMCCGLIRFPAQPASQCVMVVGIPIIKRSHGAFVGVIVAS